MSNHPDRSPPTPPTSRRAPIRSAVATLLVLTIVCVAIYTALWVADFGTLDQAPWRLVVARGATETLTSFAEVTVGILGMAITVVAIIVELAANRYTPRITELFLADPVNGFVLGFFVVTSVTVVWVDMSLWHGTTHPQTMALFATLMMSGSLLAILPYFIYVFDFLSPTSVIDRIRQTGTEHLHRLASQGKSYVPRARIELVRAVEQLGDIALNSVEKKDKPLTFACLSALMSISRAHIELKDRLPEDWFQSSIFVADDQDFVALHPDIVRALTDRGTWLDMKILRQYQAIFSESVNRLRDVNHMVAIHTRRIARFAMQQGDTHVVRLSCRFLYTFMRTTINGRDVRTAYNLFNEYRLLAEFALSIEQDELVLEIATKIKFYGQLAFSSKLGFVLEIAAYDLCSLLEVANNRRSEVHDPVLEVFLDVDREPEGGKAQESALRGVRKAQIKLATHYLDAGRQDLARRIFEDMRHEEPARLISIRAELEAVEDQEYWEVVDRGVDFEYLPPERRAMISTFFSWFDHV